MLVERSKYDVVGRTEWEREWLIDVHYEGSPHHMLGPYDSPITMVEALHLTAANMRLGN